ncbi:hypothetical protein [Bradyrhizobium cytisi]|nr:hypothetical protein [Bradyrhizobium cytisi]
MTEAERKARETIAMLYRETPPEVARRLWRPAGAHGQLGFYICRM